MIIDLLYIGGTIAFFAAMLGYIRGCQRLGRADEDGAR
jgi:hypothetical protein